MAKSSKSFLDMEEHRKFERVPADYEILVRNQTQPIPGAEQSSSAFGAACHLLDLSFNGARIAGPFQLGTVDDRLELMLPLGTKGGNISIIGTVVRSEHDATGYLTAVRFGRIAVADQVKLTEILKKLGEDSIGQFTSAPLSPMRKRSKASPKKRSTFGSLFKRN
ncbi:MAG: PilZ domain-containing protein [Gammaproteobacteria bacterium]|nr:PilZ domain-containing protein [Gammaproteobacteria bacterium]